MSPANEGETRFVQLFNGNRRLRGDKYLLYLNVASQTCVECAQRLSTRTFISDLVLQLGAKKSLHDRKEKTWRKKEKEKGTENSPQLELLKFPKYEVPSQPCITDVALSLKSPKSRQADYES